MLPKNLAACREVPPKTPDRHSKPSQWSARIHQHGVYPASRDRRFGTWIGSGSRPSWLAMSRPGDGLHAIGRGTRSSRGRFPTPGSRRPVGSPVPASMSRWLVDSSAVRFRRPNRWGLDAIAKGLRISDDSARRGLHAAELAGLLAVEREPGCKLAVSVLDLPGPESRPERRPLYGPIPWSWWLPASRLPGKSLQVGAVCWLLGRLGAIGGFRAGVGWLGGSRPLPVLGLPGPG